MLPAGKSESGDAMGITLLCGPDPPSHCRRNGTLEECIPRAGQNSGMVGGRPGRLQTWNPDLQRMGSYGEDCEIRGPIHREGSRPELREELRLRDSVELEKRDIRWSRQSHDDVLHPVLQQDSATHRVA